jgi:hypothetical protein
MNHRSVPHILALIAMCLLHPLSGAIPPPPPVPLDQQVAHSDFVGIVECVEAVPGCSRFRPVETWKGALEQDEVWYGFTALREQRVVVFLHRAQEDAARGRHRLPGWYRFPGFPMDYPYWPAPPPDYVATRGTPRVPLPYDADSARGDLFEQYGSLDAYREVIQSIVEAEPVPVQDIGGAEGRFWEYSPASRQQLRQCREQLGAQVHRKPYDNTEAWFAAFMQLTMDDPGHVAKYLCRMKLEQWGEAWSGDKYAAVSYFARFCRTDRTRHMGTLFKAEDDRTRLLGATSLYFEDPGQGAPLLESYARKGGALGAWAAAVLACDGRGEYVSQGLRALHYVETGVSLEPETRTVASWMLALLSNTAAINDLPQPAHARWIQPYLTRKEAEPLYRACADWWEERGDALRVAPLVRADLP